MALDEPRHACFAIRFAVAIPECSLALSIVKYLLTGNSSAQMYFIPVYVQLVLLTPALGKLLDRAANVGVSPKVVRR